MAMALHYMNVGMLSSRIFQAPLDRQMIIDETADDRRGILVMPDARTTLQVIAKMIADAPKEPMATEGMIVPGNMELMDELEAASPVHNLQMVYVVMPKIGDLTSWVDYPDSIEAAHGLAPIVNLANPKRYPQIYQAKHWHDDAHLNEAGARVATRLMAETLKTWYATHGQPAGCGR